VVVQVSRGEVETLVDAFPGQSIDFFGALRARVYDDKVRASTGLAKPGRRVHCHTAGGEGVPVFQGSSRCYGSALR
jgi:hypothetical protein